MAVEVALFVTCMVDQLAPEAGVAAVRLLEAAGCTVLFPAAQSCCGQPAPNPGVPGPPLRRGLRALRDDRDAVGVVCRDGAPLVPEHPRGCLEPTGPSGGAA